MKKQKNYKLFLIFGILVVIFLFLIIELINPYAFLEDDNASQFLPNILEGMKELFKGNFPSINLHQLMGTKILETGTYAVLYPPMILSYFFSHYILGNDFLTIEIFVLLHLILGFIFSFLFIKKHSSQLIATFFGALAFIFSGYIISLSRAWYYVSPVILFLPLIFYLNDQLNKRGTWWVLGILRGIYFYSGNAQYFVFTLFFEFIYFIIREYQSEWSNFSNNFRKYLFSLFLSFIILFPLLYSQIQISIDSPRGDILTLKYLLSRGAFPTDIFIGTIIFPSLLVSKLFFRYSAIHYSGTLFSLLFFLGGIYLLKKYKKESFKKISPIFWCGMLSILLSLGILGFFYSIGAIIPFIKNFEGPFKFIIFTNFFMISFGSIILSRLIEKRRVKKLTLLILFSIFSIFLLGSIVLSSSELNLNYLGELPLQKNYFNNLYDFEDYRFISISTGSDFSPKNASTSLKTSNYPEVYFLSKNFATYFDLDHISGYEPFMDGLTYEKNPVFREGISNKHLNITTLQAYGVKYIIIFKEGLSFHSELSDLRVIYEKDDFLILEIPDTKGYVFYEGGNLNYTRLHNGFYFDTFFKDKKNITINLLYKEGYVCKVNGDKIDIKQDYLGRMIIEAPSGYNKIHFYYLPEDFMVGILISLVLFTLLSLLFLNNNRLKNNFPKIKINKLLSILYKNKGKIIILILIMCTVFLFFSLFSKKNIENSIENKFGVNIEIKDIDFSFKTISFKEVSLLNNGRVTFYSSEILLIPDYKESFNHFLSHKEPILIFKEIKLSNISSIFQFSNLSDDSCDLNLNISYPEFLNNLTLFTLSKEEIFINNSYLYLPNRFSISLEKEDFNFSSNIIDKVFYLDANLSIGRYIFGDIYLYDKESINNTKKDCFILPIEHKNNIFY